MAVNVECAGGGTKRVVTVIRKGKKVARHLNGRACGWEGERFALGATVYGDAKATQANDDAARTAKPCPRCGGTVKLIEQEGTTTGGDTDAGHG